MRIGCVVLAGVFLANCANDQVARRGRSKEIGAFPSSKYGPASPRVIADGEPVPKGGGRQLIGRPYSVAGKRYAPYDKPLGYTQIGTASWYGEAFHGRRTANGEVYDRQGISAAHPTMPLPAYARVTNLLNSRSIIVRVNDRGPYHGGRVMDVSQKTADALAFRHLGTARIKLEYLGQASLGGSDDKLLLATLRTDGQPAAIPGTSARTMVASNAPVSIDRTQSADLDESPREESFRPEPAPAPVSQPVVQAYAPEQPVVRTIAPAAPVAASMTTAPAQSAAVVVRGAPLPPNRPFDLDTIANASRPVTVRPTNTPTLAPLPPARATVASLFAAPERAPIARFSKNHPLARDLKAQQTVPLARN
ncbi:septal ring lytic transglycosylase RlpA family protein [Bosea caraganae]|uniref:Endolytic peptidoglycan transglycosylase RlpA n=1 Tax=Bosea caraganae TaxID=2763117 RepID=A0A370KZA5_9HYPH|nr:septal ring lytic transglycosylase RlpA family protein [Bosea caraganae]RDJ20335.1 septal ring lytic transglycosylase RlpA family protein [Bosea caraganae]RDJ26583.1 septal ring lytic transglycosylase RlpA family protein [Bosea caraganae]